MMKLSLKINFASKLPTVSQKRAEKGRKTISPVLTPTSIIIVVDFESCTAVGELQRPF